MGEPAPTHGRTLYETPADLARALRHRARTYWPGGPTEAILLDAADVIDALHSSSVTGSRRPTPGGSPDAT